jgi:hypothetical protein
LSLLQNRPDAADAALLVRDARLLQALYRSFKAITICKISSYMRKNPGSARGAGILPAL